MTGIDSDLSRLCDTNLGTWRLMHFHRTQRPGSHVLRLQAFDGCEYVVKRHINQVKHQREIHAYTHWTATLEGRSPRLVAADQSIPAIILTTVPGQPVLPNGDGRQSATDADLERQAGELLRRFHSAEPQAPPVHPQTTLQERLNRWLPDAHRILPAADLHFVRRCMEQLTGLPTLPIHPCHLDYQPRNWLIDNGAVHVVDFEHARLDMAVRDFVRLEYGHWVSRPDLREAFYDGYGRQLGDAERSALIGCAAITAVTAVVRGTTGDNPVLASHGQAILTRLHASLGTQQHARAAKHSRSQPSARHALSTGLIRHLTSPDRTGQDLALYRARSYRFSDDLRHYVLAECLEERFLEGALPTARTVEYIRGCLSGIRRDGQILDFDAKVSSAEGIDAEHEILKREAHNYTRTLSAHEPEMIVAIVGAPRSGTSHLVNLLARHGNVGYFTTATCWAWPIRNLDHPGRTLFTAASDIVLTVDNKRTRTIPALVMPGEAEDVYARAVPVYRHLAGHRYEIHPCRIWKLDVLRGGINAHLQHFGSSTFLTKSPFNSLRIPVLEQIWGTRARYIHIVREQHGAADSMRRNYFEFVVDGVALTAEHAWTHFTSTVENAAPMERTLTVTHHDLLTDPNTVIELILEWLGVEGTAPTPCAKG